MIPQYTSWIAWLIVSWSATARPLSWIRRTVSLSGGRCIAWTSESPMLMVLALLRRAFVRSLRLAGVHDVGELPPEDHDERRRADEGEPERSGEPERPREQAADRRTDNHPADDRDSVDARDATEELVRHGPLTDDRRGRVPDERVRAKDGEHHERHRRDGRERQHEVRNRLDQEADPHDVGEGEVALEP